MNAKIIGAAIGFISANYLYQAFGGGHWWVAHERSIFQAVALAYVWFSLNFLPTRSHD